jgi:Fe2+ or Zn2+ uptake regulation protein
VRHPDELAARFRAQGMKVTPQRQRIFEVLHARGGHPTAEAIYSEVVADMPTVSLRTVYQALNDLVAMGELLAVDVDGGPVRFDTTTRAHHHVVCDQCRRVVDVLDDVGLQLPASVAEDFVVYGVEVVFRARCRTCQSVEAVPPVLG